VRAVGPKGDRAALQQPNALRWLNQALLGQGAPDRTAAIAEALVPLSDRDVRLLVLLCDGLPFAEISQELGVRVGAVPVARRRVLGRLRVALTD
jgi:DNA-binding NarL/FixJ family response regulator